MEDDWGQFEATKHVSSDPDMKVEILLEYLDKGPRTKAHRLLSWFVALCQRHGSGTQFVCPSFSGPFQETH